MIATCPFGCLIQKDHPCYHVVTAQELTKFMSTGRVTNLLALRAQQEKWFSSILNERILTESHKVERAIQRFSDLIWIGQKLYAHAKQAEWKPWEIREEQKFVLLSYVGGERVSIHIQNEDITISIASITVKPYIFSAIEYYASGQEAEDLIDWVIEKSTKPRTY